MSYWRGNIFSFDVSWRKKETARTRNQGLMSAKLQLCLRLIITLLYLLSSVLTWHSDPYESYDISL
jgi:hypothetical protein